MNREELIKHIKSNWNYTCKYVPEKEKLICCEFEVIKQNSQWIVGETQERNGFVEFKKCLIEDEAYDYLLNLYKQKIIRNNKYKLFIKRTQLEELVIKQFSKEEKINNKNDYQVYFKNKYNTILEENYDNKDFDKVLSDIYEKELENIQKNYELKVKILK